MNDQRYGSILYVISSLDLGGAERHLSMIVPEIAARGRDATVFCLTGRGALADPLEAQGVRVIAPMGSTSPMAGRVTAGWRFLRTSFSLLGYVLHKRPKIVHTFLPRAYCIAGPISLIAGVPVRIMSRRSRNIYQARQKWAAAIEKRLHPKMTAILGNSHAVVDDLLQEGCPSERVGLIYNGTDLSTYDLRRGRGRTREDLNIDNDCLLIIVVANLIAYKGHADLLEALAGIRNQLPTNWEVLCVGRDDGIQSQLEAQSNALGLGRHIRFMGTSLDVPELLMASDIGVLASHQEGFSNTVIEMMAAGLASVVTDVGGNKEAVLDEVTGLVVPDHAPSELGEAILRLATDRGLRKRLGEASRKRAEQCFGLETCVSQYDRLYRYLETCPSDKVHIADALNPPE